MKERLYFFYSFKRLRIKPGIALLLKISSSRKATNIPFNKWKLKKNYQLFFHRFGVYVLCNSSIEDKIHVYILPSHLQ